MSASLSLVSWNVEKLASYLGDAPRRAPLVDVAATFGMADVLCLQELRLRPLDRDAIRLASNALPGYAFFCSLANDPKNVRFRGGRAYGVVTYVRRTLEIVEHPNETWDREGRLSVLDLPSLRISIMNVYAVNGTFKPHWSYEKDAYDGDRHQWKRRFHEHVADSARSAMQRGLDVVIVGDWNVSQTALDTTPRLRTEEPHATSRRHFAETIIGDLDVVDVFRKLHPTTRAYTWFNRLARNGELDAARVDFALLSRRRLGEVVEASIDEEPSHHFGSDHAPLRLVLSLGL